MASLGTSLTEEHAALLTRYTDQVILIYDGDEAGQRASARAIPILEKAGLQIRVLKMKDAKDPDEYLKKFGADSFKVLLEDASNRVEYQINAIRRKYDLREDDQRVEFVTECAKLIASLPSSIQREVYGRRVAEEGKITYEAMQTEVKKVWKQRQNREKKAQEKIDLAPAQATQPKSRNIRYDNVKSARAEESLIAQAMKEPALLDLTRDLKPEEFSVPLFAKVYTQMRDRFDQHLPISPATLEELSGDEASHIALVISSQSGPINEQAFRDCISTIQSAHRKSSVTSEDDLMAMRKKLQERKGMKL